MQKQHCFFLIDDDQDDTWIFEEILKEVDPSVEFRSAVNGQNGLDKLRELQTLPDLIFLDLNMPRMGGMEFLAEIKNDPLLRAIPVIIYTTSSRQQDIEATKMKGAVSFITKPSNTTDLKKILASIAADIPLSPGKKLDE